MLVPRLRNERHDTAQRVQTGAHGGHENVQAEGAGPRKTHQRRISCNREHREFGRFVDRETSGVEFRVGRSGPEHFSLVQHGVRVPAIVSTRNFR